MLPVSGYRGAGIWRWLSLCLATWASLGLEAADPARFENEVQRLAQDGADRQRPGAVVFAGSSSIRMWKTLQRDFPGRRVVNRGFGGSHMSDLVHFAPRLILPLRPRLVFVYEGDNDLADGKTPEVVLGDFRRFVSTVHHALPRTRIVFVAVKPSPSRRRLLEVQRELNQRLREYCMTDPGLGFVDVFQPMLDGGGEPRAELFAADRLHLNEAGYALWTDIFRRWLKQAERLRITPRG